MSKAHLPRIMNSALLALLVTATASLSACSKEPEKKDAWNCTTDQVPMGEVVRCSTAALTLDSPVASGSASPDTTTSAGTTTTDTSGATAGTTTYECGSDGADCPPSDTQVATSGATSDSATTGTSDSRPPSDSTTGSTATGSTDASTGDTAGGSGASTSGSTGPGKGNGNGNGNGNGKSGSAPGGKKAGVTSSSDTGGCTPNECSYVPDLPYCSDSGSTGTAPTDQGASAPGASNDSTAGSSGASGSPGSSSTDSPTSGPSSSSGKTAGKGRHWTCTKDNDGNKTCTSVPTCAAGSHPSACGACVADDAGATDCVPPSVGGCWVTGGGFIAAPSLVPAVPADGNDNFGGNAKPMKDGHVQGHWNHVDQGTGNHLDGHPEYIYCRHVDEPGPGQPGGKKGFNMNQVYFGGHARFRANDAWADGYWFDVVAKDHGEPGSQPSPKNGGMPDTYHITIRKVDDPVNNASGVVVYETKGELVGGNIQLHPPNNGHPAVNSPLPTWVGLEP